MNKEKANSKSIMERLGLQTVRKLNLTICRQRVRFLKANLKLGKYKGDLKKYAEYYANWYGWMAKNGGTRSKSKKAA